MSNDVKIDKNKVFKARIATYDSLAVSESERVNGLGNKYNITGNDGTNDIKAFVVIYDTGKFVIQGSKQGNIPKIFADLQKD